MQTLWSKFRRSLHAFKKARAGNVAITFAFATLPVVGAVGAAVDFSHANSVKAALQAALDSTALMVAKDAPNLNDGDLDAKALAYFKALFTRPEAKGLVINATYTTSGGSAVVVEGSVDVPTTFLGVFGKDYVTVGGTSKTKWGSTRLRVALALDVTGSMASDGKMTALKSATKNLLTQLSSAAGQNGDVYVSIIPFNKDVNVGASNYNANWIDWTDWDAQNQTCSGGGSSGGGFGGGGWGGGGGGWGGGGGGWGSGGSGGGSSCVPKNHNTWNGCVTDRGPSNAPGNSTWDQVVTLPDGTKNSLWPAEQYGSCPVAMMGLNYNWASMNSVVDSLQPVGSTNQPIGLVWAWQSLVGGGPFTAPAKQSGADYKEIIILMSDGLNTEDRWYGNDPNASQAVDNRMYQQGNGSGTCANIKASGVTIYTVHVNTDGDPKSTLLQNCASTSDKFWMITSAADLNGVFNKIGTNLTQLRVAE